LDTEQLGTVLQVLKRSEENIWYRPYDPYNKPDGVTAKMMTMETGFDTSACCMSQHICFQLKEKGIPPHARITLFPGNTVVLPDGCGHSFQKVPFNQAILSPFSLSKMSKESLMLSIAGFFFFSLLFLIFFFFFFF
jgi:hypothetical protein